jgi:murein DD-endopeptidase MepM/ murein hydrolase activator NlpD
MGGRGKAPRRVAWCLLMMGISGCASARPPGPASAVPGRADAPSEPALSDAPLVGGCGLAPASLIPLYVLPYPPGESYTLTQGNCGSASHGGRFSYAFDFEMPIGTPVIAARDGIVHAVRDDRPDGSGRGGDENFVILDHGDGQFSRYIHLTRGGARVARGDRVTLGDTIALSGHSGRSAFPHLHFDVSTGCRGGTCRTIPSAFTNVEPPIPTGRRGYDAGSFAASLPAASREGGSR